MAFDVMGWIKANPMVAVAGAGGVGLLLYMRSKGSGSGSNAGVGIGTPFPPLGWLGAGGLYPTGGVTQPPEPVPSVGPPVVYTGPPHQCPQGMTYDPTTQQCVGRPGPSPGGGGGGVQPFCGPGTIWNGTTCVPLIPSTHRPVYYGGGGVGTGTGGVQLTTRLPMSEVGASMAFAAQKRAMLVSNARVSGGGQGAARATYGQHTGAAGRG